MGQIIELWIDWGFRRLSKLIKSVKAENVLYKGGEPNKDKDFFIPPYIVNASFDDLVMKEEVK